MKNVRIVLWTLCAFALAAASQASAEDDKRSRDITSQGLSGVDNPPPPNIDYKRQGFSMRLRMDNRGVFGRQAYPGGNTALSGVNGLGLEYPVGTNIEHIFGGGIWVGGLLNTAPPGQPPVYVKKVTTAYEGWSGPLYEMFPGDTPADTFWRAKRGQTVAPPGWEAYWGASLPFKPISDDDFHCVYTDTANPVTQHVPLGLKVIQSSYAWDDPYAEAIIIIEYRIINVGRNTLDSAYVGFFFEADVGPISASSYWVRNFTGYYSGPRLAYIHNPADRGSTPVGAALLSTSKPLDSLRYTFAWYPGPQSPTPDEVRYNLLSSGVIREDEYPAMSDTRFLFGFGPFTIRPSSGLNPDTLKIAVAVVSGFSRTRDPRTVMQRNAARALDIYLNQGIRLPATPPSPPLRMNVGFRRVELDWKWRPGDDVTYGRPDPEQNWDTTNQVARRYAERYSSPPIGPYPPPPGIDTSRGGRNFSAYRIWRSENPDYPDDSFTLLAQYDVPTDSFEYNTGLNYRFVDSNLVRGKTYVYSVTSLSIPNLAEQRIRVGDTTITVEVPVEPLESSFRANATPLELPFAVSREVGKVSVVPNPYRTDKDYTLESGGYEGKTSAWNENLRVIKFINLPQRCTIRIFSLSGDLIRTVEHNGGDDLFPRGDATVPLLSESNRALASGIYIFTVESEFGVQTGKFVIIR